MNRSQELELEKRLPDCIGPYAVEGRLGHGGMGVVYRVRHMETGVAAAIKTVMVPDQLQLFSLRREINGLARINHPGVIRILEQGIHNGFPWYAMELLEGITLRDALAQMMDETQEEETYSLISLLDCIRQVCRSLAYLHGEGILHLDLKPENIFLTQAGMPILMDFGLMSRFSGKLNRESVDVDMIGIGTLGYMAPEVMLGDLVDARADLFSIGCILYELLMAEPPYPGETTEEVLKKQVSQTLDKPSDFMDSVPEELENLILRLLAIDPYERLGFADDIALYLEALGIGSDDDVKRPVPKSYLYRTRFTGRLQIFNEIDAHLARLQASSGSFVLIEGESGMGKSRLAMEISRYCQKHNISVLVGECRTPRSHDGATTEASALRFIRTDIDYLPEIALQEVINGQFRIIIKPLQMIADFCRSQNQQICDQIFGPRGKILAIYDPDLRNLPGQENYSEPVPLPAPEAVNRIIRAMAITLLKFTKINKTLLIIDDLQWLDDLSFRFLKYLIELPDLKDHALLILGTCRTEESNAPLELLRKSSAIQSFLLTPFNEQDVHQLVSDMLAWKYPNILFVKYLSQHSEGNPFFVAEYLRVAVEQKVLYRDAEGRWTLLDPCKNNEHLFQGLPLPSTLSDIIWHRIQHFTIHAQEMTKILAVISRETSENLLFEASQMNEWAFLSGLQELLARNVLEETGSGNFRFVHDKLRESAYFNMDPFQRKILHARIAHILEQKENLDKTELYPELGLHFEMAEDFPAARKYYLESARITQSRYAYKESRSLFEKYLFLAGPASAENIRVRIDLSLQVLDIMGNTKEAIQNLMIAKKDSENTGNMKTQADAMAGLAHLYWHTGKISEGNKYANDALAIYRQIPDIPSEGQLLHSMANAYRHQGMLFKSLDLLNNSLAIHQRLKDRHWEGRIISDQGKIALEMGHTEKGYRLLIKALRIHQIVRDRVSEGITLCRIGRAKLLRGDLNAAVEQIRTGLAIHREVGYRREEARALLDLSFVQANSGLPDEAFVSAKEALTIAREISDHHIEGTAMVHLAEIAKHKNDSTEALFYFTKAAETFDSLNDSTQKAQTLLEIARLLRLTGSTLDLAEEKAYEAECIFRNSGIISEIILCLCERGHISLANHSPDYDLFLEARKLIHKAKLDQNGTAAFHLKILQKSLEAFQKKIPLYFGQISTL